MYHSLVQLIAATRLIAREGGATIAELVEHLGITRRSVYRLFDALDELNYPYYRDEEHGGRIKLENPGHPPARWMPMPSVEFDLEDRVVLDWLFDFAAARPSLAEPIRNLRRKLDLMGAMSGYALAAKESGAGPHTERTRILHSAVPGKSTKLQKDSWLPLLLRAAEEHRVCNVSYESRTSGTIASYPVHPLSVFESEDSLYAYVEMPRNGTIRILALERLHELSVSEDRFDPPPGFSAQERLSDPFGIVQDEATAVVLLFAAWQAPYVKERAWPPTYRFIDRPDGRLEMRFVTRGIYGLKRWILGWAEEVEVLEPEGLRREIADAIASMRRIYAKSAKR